MMINYADTTQYNIEADLLEIASPYTNLSQFLEQTAELSLSLPIELKKAVMNFKLKGNEASCLVIKNLPIDLEVPVTPNAVNNINKKTFFSEGMLAAISFLLGEPYSYQQEGDGKLIHNLFPLIENTYEQSSASSKVHLEFHTEIVFHPFPPDFLVLYCLRQDPQKQAKTLIGSLRKVLKKELLTGGDIKLLRQPLYKTGIDYSFGNLETTKANGPIMPCLYGDPVDPLLSFDSPLMVGLTKESNNAYLNLKNALEVVSEAIMLQCGELIIIDNRRATHGRSAFPAYFDGTDRWLQRCVVARNFQQAEILFSKKERIISFTDFHKVVNVEYSKYAE